MAQFFLTWLSYFLICFVVAYVGLAIVLKNPNPLLIFYWNLWFAGAPFLIVVVLSFLFALVSKIDPLGWLWTDLAHTAAEHPCPLGCRQ